MASITYNYLKPEHFKCFTKYAFNEVNDKSLSFEQSDDYADSAGILAYNITCSVPRGYNKLVEMYPGYKPFFDQLLYDKCNVTHFIALKMNSGSAMQEHVDDGITDFISDYSRRIIPFSTNIFYAKIPADMKGGQLYVKEDGDTKFYTPQENMKIEFSGGDTPHGVTRVTSERGVERCMIVCEQYKLSLRCLRKIQEIGDPILRKG